jgi:hypothetical protein
LNKGHKYFFVDKHNFLFKRVWLIFEELKVRNYKLDANPGEWEDLSEGFDDEFFGEYVPDLEAMAVSNQRILERISQKPDWYRYKGEVKDLEFFKKLINENE